MTEALPKTVFWLSFVDTEKSAPRDEQVPGGGGFLGVLIVRAETAAEAVADTWHRKLNPGGEVSIVGPLPPQFFKERDMYRLLTADEAWALDVGEEPTDG